MAKKSKRTAEEKKELNWKIAEIIWYSIGGIILAGGLTFSILGLLIVNMSGNFKNHPFYQLYLAQNRFISWLGWGGSYAEIGLMLILLALVYFIIAISLFARRQDAKEKRLKKAKERRGNFKLIIENPVEENEQKQDIKQTQNTQNAQ